MKKSNRSIVEKADLAVSDLVSDGGYLNPEQATTFIRMLIDQPTLLNEIRVVPMNSPTMEINKIGFAGRILRKAPASGTALPASKRSKPTTDKVELATKEVIAEVHIPYDVLEDNIERGRLEDTLMSLISERASLDLEELLLLGGTDPTDEYLELCDGMLVQSTSHHVEYIDSLADRETALGDSRITGKKFYPRAEVAYGVPVVPAALMPNSNYLFTFPKNLILGVQRQIMIETDRDIRARVLIVVLTLRIDIKYEEEDAVVKCTGLNPNQLTTTTSP